jgi:hypothetical protein
MNTVPVDHASGPRYYRISPWRRGVFHGIMVSMALIIALLSFGSDAADRNAGFAVAGVLLLIGAAMVPLVWYPRLRVSNEGLELRQVGWRMTAEWQNVDRVLDPPAFGLVLKEPMAGAAVQLWRVSIRVPFLGTFLRLDTDLIEQGRLVPLDPFAYYWTKGELQQDFRRYAPGLFRS